MNSRKKGTIIFIIFGIVAIICSLCWINSYRNRTVKAKASTLICNVIVDVTEDVFLSPADAVPGIDRIIAASHVMSHRGMPDDAEEHTFKSYDLAVEAGTLYLEQDLVLSADGTLFISHDLSPYKMTGRSGDFADMTDTEIESLHTYGGSEILRLTDVFERYGKSVCYVPELKDSSSATVQAFIDAVSEYGMENNVIVQSFEADALEAVEEVYPDMPKIFLVWYQQEFENGLSLDCADIISVNDDIMSESNCKAAHDAGKKFSVWKLDYEYSIRKAIEIGVDSYFTNETPLALELEQKYRVKPILKTFEKERKKKLKKLEALKAEWEKGSDSGSGSDSDSDSGSDSAGSGKASSNDELQACILCASDYQIEYGQPTPKENLTALIDSVLEGDKTPNALIYCGDYTNDSKLHDYQLSPEDSISEIRDVVDEEIANNEAASSGNGNSEGTDNLSGNGNSEGTGNSSGNGSGDETGSSSGNALDPGDIDDNMIFVQGNHDALTDSISESGLHEYEDYLVYVLNTQNDFPWKQGKTRGCLAKVTRASEELEDCLSELSAKGEKRPVIIAGHVPLHFTARTSSKHTTGDNMYSSLIFNVVNEAAESLDIIYLFGHNHSKGWDCYMGGSSVYKQPGDRILIPEFTSTAVNSDSYTSETLNFTYLNAGYTGYYMNCGYEEYSAGTWKDYEAADGTLTVTTLEIYEDRIVITRWDEEGIHRISGQGEGDPYKGGIDSGLIPSSEYATQKDSPQTISRHINTLL